MYFRFQSTLLAGTMLAGAVFAAPVASYAQSQSVNFDIPSEPASAAIADFARQSGLQVVAPTRDLHGVMAPALVGRLEAREALRRLLTRLPLEISSDNGTTIVLRRSTGATPAMFQRVSDASVSAAPAPETAGSDAAVTRPDKATTLQEVVVTARKTAEAASKTPVALSVFSGKSLQDLGVVNAADLQYITPGLDIGSASHGVSITVRGVTTTDVTSKGDQDIVFSVDGIPIGRPQEMGLAFFDLDRVEVLRGPQGTLYGKSSTAGAINVITARPKDAFDASATVELGNYDTRRGTAMVNLPITDNLAIRVAGNFNLRDGFLKPDLGNSQTVNTEAPRADENNWTTRVSALWTINSSASLLLTGTFGHIGGAGDANDAIYNRVEHASGDGRFNIFYNPMVGAGGDDDNFNNYNAEFNWDLGPVHMTYDGAHMQFRGDDDFDPSTGDPASTGGTPNYTWNTYHSNVTTDSHEVRFSNAHPQALEWVFGANYWKEYNVEDDLNWQTLASCAPSLAPSCNNPNPNIVGPTEHQAVGVFGQGNYHVTDKLRLTLGLRYSSDSMYRHAVIAAGQAPASGWLDAQGQPCSPPHACIGAGTTNDYGTESAQKLTWRVGADYQLASNQMVYASVATGYKPGGFNDVDPTSPTHGTGAYGPESVTAYELGYKGRLLPNLQFNSDVYYYDYSKYQLTGATFMTPNATGGAPLVLIYTTLAPATLYGWENELSWRPTPNDTFNATLAFERGYFDKGANEAHVGFIFSNQIPWGGKSLDNMPEVAATLLYEHRWNLADGSVIKARVNSKLSTAVPRGVRIS